MSARLARRECLRGPTKQKAVPGSGRKTPSSFSRPPPRPGPAPRSFCRCGEISAQDSGWDCRERPWAFPGLSPPQSDRGEGRDTWLKTSLKTTPWSPQLRGLPLILVTESWAPWSSARGDAKEGRNEHPRITEFSPPRPGLQERLPKTLACLDRVRPRGCGGWALGVGRGGVQGWPRSDRAAETAPRRNHSQSCPPGREE